MPIAPSAGTVTVNGDGEIEFTPLADFTGTCAIGYQVIDGVGQSDTAQLTVTVNAPGAATFPNGYEARGEVWAVAQSETMADFPLLIDYTDPLLRTQANGGVVRNSSGHDIRLEDGAGNKLQHKRILYDGTAGRILAVVKRSLDDEDDRKIEIYAGKQGSVTDEENAAALDGHHAYWRMDTGADLTGSGRNLTVSGAVAATLFGCPAATFDGVDDGATLSDPSTWLNGVSELTLLVDLKHAQVATDAGFYRVGGTAKGADTSAHWTARQDAESSSASPISYRNYNCHWKFSGSVNCRIEGEAERLQTGDADCFATAWKAGEAIAQFSRGTKETIAYAQVATPGGTLAVPGGPLAFGNGTRAYWSGTMGLARIAKTRRSDAWILAECQNRLAPMALLAKGVMRTPSDTTPPVAFPDEVPIIGSPMFIEPLGNDTGTGLTIVSATASSGSVSIVSSGTRLLFTPVDLGSDATITYTVQDSLGRRSTSVIVARGISVVSITADAANVNEGDSGTTAVTFTVPRTGNLDLACSVAWEVDLSGPLSVGYDDFVDGSPPVDQELTWEAGDGAPKTITINIQGDADVEPAETLTIRLSEPVNCRLGSSEATTTIGNDDAGEAYLAVAAASSTITEGNSGTKILRFVVARSGETSTACSASWTRTGTANSTDITAGGSSGTVEFAAGETAQNIDFTLAGDTTVESDETVILTLSDPVDCTLLISSATTTILNDDTAGEAGEFPTPLRTLTVDSSSELTTLINTTSGTFPAAITISGPDRNAPYRAGDLIVLKNGAYNSFTISRSGSTANPIFIKAENKLGVTVNGTWTLSGNNLSIWGFDFNGADAKLATSGDSIKVIRCKVRGIRTDATASGGKIAVVPTGQDNWFMFCEWTDIDGRGASCDNSGAKPLRPLFYRCYFHDWKNPLSGSSGNGRECIQFGQSQAPDGSPNFYEMKGRALYCLFEDVYQSAPGIGERAHDENEPLSNKCSGNEITGCTFIRSKNLNIRFGTNCLVKSNWIGAGSQIGVYGDDHVIIANNASTGNYIGIFSGSQYQDVGSTGENAGLARVYDGSNDYPACRRVKCISNIGELRVGQNNVSITTPAHPKVKAKNVRIEAHSGTIRTQVNYSGSWDTPTSGYLEENTTYTTSPSMTAPAAVQLTTADVGLNAPWSEPDSDPGGPTDSYTAADDTASAKTGTGNVDIDVLLNDTASGAKTLISVTAVAPLTSGQVSIANGKLRIVKTGLAAGTYQATYRGALLSNTAIGGTGTATLTLTDDEPPPPPGDFPKEPPAATATLRVPEDYSTIAAALAAASPGNHISVANGTYREEITSAKNGSATGWIVIKARNHLGATLAGSNTADPDDSLPKSWKFTGSYIWVTGFVCNNPQHNSPNFYVGGRNSYYNSDRPEYQFRLAGDNLRVTNCLINSPCGIGIANGTSGVTVCYNTFTMSQTPRWPQANGIFMGVFSYTSRGPDNVTIARNKWVVSVEYDKIDDDGDDGRYCLYTGNNEPRDNDVGNNRSVLIAENFVNTTNVPVGFYCKRGYELRRNFIRAGVVAFNLRHGGCSKSDGTVFSGLTDAKRALMVGNNFDRGIFRLNDTDHLVVSNRFGGNVELYYGGRRTEGTTTSNYTISGVPPGWTQAASRAIFVGNTFVGSFRLGDDEGTNAKKWKVWGAAEQTKWGAGEPDQGGTIKGVKNYAAGVTQPTPVRVTNLYGEATSAAGTAGYQEFTGDGGYTSYLTSYVTRAELETTTGCDDP